jgi:hypothetical protein
MHDDEVDVDAELVRRLLASQMPALSPVAEADADDVRRRRGAGAGELIAISRGTPWAHRRPGR